MSENAHGLEPIESGIIIAEDLKKFKGLLYVQCGNIERARAIVEMVAKEGVKLSEKSEWYYSLAKDLFTVCKRLDEACSGVNTVAGLIGIHEIREFDLSSLEETEEEDVSSGEVD